MNICLINNDIIFFYLYSWKESKEIYFPLENSPNLWCVPYKAIDLPWEEMNKQLWSTLMAILAPNIHWRGPRGRPYWVKHFSNILKSKTYKTTNPNFCSGGLSIHSRCVDVLHWDSSSRATATCPAVRITKGQVHDISNIEEWTDLRCISLSCLVSTFSPCTFAITSFAWRQTFSVSHSARGMS